MASATDADVFRLRGVADEPDVLEVVVANRRVGEVAWLETVDRWMVISPWAARTYETARQAAAAVAGQEVTR
jgi:hypothetical protein